MIRQGLAAALRLAIDDRPALDPREDELADMLRQQLAAPLTRELGAILGTSMAKSARRLLEPLDPPIESFGDLLRHPAPPLALLLFAKQFAKESVDHSTRPLPAPLARVLYQAVLAVAQQHGHEISGLSDAARREGVQWALGRPWLDPMLRELLQGAEERGDERAKR